ncbi:MAG: HAMP domain-containing histidine kinase [Chloroflexi bacterium]|nr:MAG: HAMP domain-containing histidine kinase [Chloroflexota bacterium]
MLSYGYLVGLCALIAILNLLTRSYTATHPDRVTEVVYLIIAASGLAFVEVRLERGRLTLSALANGPAAVLLNPLDATLVGLATGFAMVRRPRWTVIANAVMTAAVTVAGSSFASLLHESTRTSLLARLAVLLVVFVASLVLVAGGLSMRTGESVQSIALLVTYLLDGSVIGYFLATIVFTLGVALTDTIAGRRVRRVLESELSDADRHLFHSRAVEGVVHNLRNHLATAVGYLKEIDTHRLHPVERDAIETAKSATNDAVTVLRSLSQGATPRVTYAAESVDLNELAARALDMARARARPKHVELGLRESSDDVKVRADPLLLREVITNLVNNAIDAAPANGHVDLTTGRRGNGSPFLSVSDNGPGVEEENRHHLFEPHFTTKEQGTGLGLFMSYGIVREHQGQLTYEGNRRGAVFTVVLPPFSGSRLPAS